MRRPAYRLHFRDRAPVDAYELEHAPGYIRALVGLPAALVVDETTRTSYRPAPSEFEWRRYRSWSMIVELGDAT